MSSKAAASSPVGEAFQPRPTARKHFHRFYVENQCYHVVSNTIRRERIFRDRTHAQVLVDAIQFVRRDRALVLSYVVMPDHFHALIVPREGCNISQVAQSIKGYSSRLVNRKLGRRGALWQSGFYDHVVRNEAELRETLAYIHRDPVVAGLAPDEESYEFSSAGRLNMVDVNAYV